MTRLRNAVFALLLALAGGCTPHWQEPPHAPGFEPPRIEGTRFHTGDGTVLPLAHWKARAPRAVVIALHGFNDYRRAFVWSAPLLAAQGVDVLAFDQRGFGGSPEAGLWAGKERLAADVRTLVRLVHARDGDRPIFLLGESMGAAVAVLAAAEPDTAARLAGVILVSPAAWGWSELNPFYRATLWTMAHIAPGWRLTGGGLKRVASDNFAALRAMGRDPLIIKATRVDAIYGLVDLMQAALDAAPGMRPGTMVLYGGKDEIVPAHAIRALIARLPGGMTTVRRYENGYHLLLRDHGRRRAVRDILAFIDRRIAGPARAPGRGPVAQDAAASRRCHAREWTNRGFAASRPVDRPHGQTESGRGEDCPNAAMSMEVN